MDLESKWVRWRAFMSSTNRYHNINSFNFAISYLRVNDDDRSINLSKDWLKWFLNKVRRCNIAVVIVRLGVFLLADDANMTMTHCLLTKTQLEESQESRLFVFS